MSIADVSRTVKRFLYVRFSLHKDKEDESEIVESIRRGIYFRGINVWILIFAILLASIGLNVNSTAVIIGAMLISPLMGPIMGIGLGLSIFDFELLKAAGKNLGIMVAISLLTSTLYFSLSPLSQAQSELLARTTPTIWDVLIALFGGLAGIVAGSTKEKGTVIAGVAIATALMPPLCTAGFGLASGDFFFFLGAFYLFCINAVFISLSTLIVTRLLKFKAVTLPDKSRERRLRNIISAVVFITVIPSILIAYITVRRELFEQRAQQYIRGEFQLANTFVLTKKTDYDNSTIRIVLAGKTLTDDSLELLASRVADYDLQNVRVEITQGFDGAEQVDIDQLKSSLIKDIYTENVQLIKNQEDSIRKLNEQIASLKSVYPIQEITDELNALGYKVSKLSIHDNIVFDNKRQGLDTVTIAYIDFNKMPSVHTRSNISSWLKTRIRSDSLLLVPLVK